jgi:hypothetical protein
MSHSKRLMQNPNKLSRLSIINEVCKDITKKKKARYHDKVIMRRNVPRIKTRDWNSNLGGPWLCPSAVILPAAKTQKV